MELGRSEADHGGVGALGVAVGCVDGNQVVTGRNGLPTGRDGLAPDRAVPGIRSVGGLNGLVDWGTWLVAELSVPDGTKNQTPVAVTATAARAPNFRTGSRRRLCRAPDCCLCLPRWNCLTS